MANPVPRAAHDYNAKIIEEFRANGGRAGGPWTDATQIHSERRVRVRPAA